MCFDSNDDLKYSVNNNLDIISLIVKKVTSENFSLRLLNEIFLKMEELYLFNVDFNIAILSKGIFKISDWDKTFS